MINLNISNSRIRATGTKEELATLKTLPGSEKEGDSITLPLAWETLRLIYTFVSKYEVSDKLRLWATTERNARQRINDKKNSEHKARDFLRPYQTPAVDWLKEQPAAILADEMGLGKTIITLKAIKEIGNYPVLIVAPKSATYTWQQETQKFFPELSTVVIEGSTAVKRNFKIAKAISESTQIFIINYSLLRQHSKLLTFGKLKRYEDPEAQGKADEKRKFESEMKMLNREWRHLIVDEAHRIANPNTKQARGLWALRQTSQRITLLSGTPIKNDMTDLWSLLRSLKPNIWDGKSKYVDLWAEKVYHPFKEFDIVGVRPDRQELFDELTQFYIMRRSVDDVSDEMPEVTRTIRTVEMGSKQSKQYKELLETKNLLGVQMVNAPETASKLRMIAQSALKVEDQKLVMTGESTKIRGLKDFLTDFEGQFIVFSFNVGLAQQTANMLNKQGYKCGLIYGDVPTEERNKIIESFQNSEIDSISATLGTLSESVTLTAAKAVIFLQRSFSLVENLQAEGRIRRLSSEHEIVHVVDIVTKDTVDELPAEAIASKKESLQQILKDAERILEWSKINYENNN